MTTTNSKLNEIPQTDSNKDAKLSLLSDVLPLETPVDSELVTTPRTPIDKVSRLSHFGDKLKQWQPGQSGNPAGRPSKGNSITSLLKDKLDQIDPATKETYAQGIVKAMVKQAQRDPQVLRELLNRCEGKVTENIDIQGTQVSITYELARKVEDKDST